jgi:hypothetical protein
VLLLLCCLLLPVMLMFITTTWAESATLTAVIAYAFFYGGFGQMVAGVFEVGVPAVVLLFTHWGQLFCGLYCHRIICMSAADLKLCSGGSACTSQSWLLRRHVETCVIITSRDPHVPVEGLVMMSARSCVLFFPRPNLQPAPPSLGNICFGTPYSPRSRIYCAPA